MGNLLLKKISFICINMDIYEMNASRRGKEYFQKYYNVPWDEDKNPTYKPVSTNLKY